jgi:riboflavin-specific deaminase-like protein
MTPRPFVRLNMAMTADGKIATSTRSVHTFGSPRDARHLYQLRAASDAILCGARTVEETNATLGNGGESFRRLRLRNGRAEHPVRVIVSGSGSFSPEARIWGHRFSPIHIWTGPKVTAARQEALQARAEVVWSSPTDPIDLAAGLAQLARDHGIRDVIVEGGGQLNDALLRARLVDELHLTLCPRIFGGRTAPTISDGTGIEHLSEAPGFTLKSLRRHGDELFLVYGRNAPEAGVSETSLP